MNTFVGDYLTKAEEAVLDAQGWLGDSDDDQTIAAIEEAVEALERAKRALEDGIVPEEDLD